MTGRVVPRNRLANESCASARMKSFLCSRLFLKVRAVHRGRGSPVAGADRLFVSRDPNLSASALERTVDRASRLDVAAAHYRQKAADIAMVRSSRSVPNGFSKQR